MMMHWSINADHPIMEARGGGGNINICTQGGPPHHLSSMPLPEASVFYCCRQLHCCSLARNFINTAQWLSECLSIHSTAIQSRFILGIKHRLWSLFLYFVVQGHCFLNSKGTCWICFLLWNETLIRVESNTAMVTLTSENDVSKLYPRAACQR